MFTCLLLAASVLDVPALAQASPPEPRYATMSFPQGDVTYALPTGGPDAWALRDLPLDEPPVEFVQQWWSGLSDATRSEYLDLMSIDLAAQTLGPWFDWNPYFPYHWSTGAPSFAAPTYVPTGLPSTNWYENFDVGSPRYQFGWRRVAFASLFGLPPEYLFMYEPPPLDLLAAPREFTGEEVEALDARTYRVEVELPAGHHEIHDPFKVLLATAVGGAIGQGPFLDLVRAFFPCHAADDDPGLLVEPDEVAEYEAIFRGDPVTSVKVRGWYVKADVDDEQDTLGLVELVTGRGAEFSQVAEEEGYRLLAARFARAGFDVWLPDKRAHGMSGGNDSSDLPRQTADLFETLDAFETGAGVRALAPDGHALTVEEIRAQLLPAGHAARDVPLLLFGRSQGAAIVQRAMSLHVLARAGMADPSSVEARAFALAHGEGTYPEPVDPAETADAMASYAAFDLKGILTFDGFAAGMQNGDYPWLAWVGITLAEPPRYFAEATTGIYFWGGWWDYRTAERWPAHFQAGGTEDFPPRSLVEMYNRERGDKEILLVDGDHGTIIRGDPVIREYVFDRAIKFARRVVQEDPDALDNAKQTTLEDELFEVVRRRRLIEGRD